MALGWAGLAESALNPAGLAPLLLLVVLLAGCSSGVPDAGPLVEDARRLALSDDPPSGSSAEYLGLPTVTLYPTFTAVPIPLPTDTPVPTPTVVGYLPPAPVPIATVTPVIHTVVSTPGPTPTAVPTPELPSGGLYGALVAQTFFGMHDTPEIGAKLPDWPAAEEIFLVRTTRFLVWYLLFDHGRIDASKVESCLMRVTVEVGPPDQRREEVVHQEPVDVEIDLEQEGDVTQVILGLGNALPGVLWMPGNYRVELWDAQDRVVAQWEFKVG